MNDMAKQKEQMIILMRRARTEILSLYKIRNSKFKAAARKLFNGDLETEDKVLKNSVKYIDGVIELCTDYQQYLTQKSITCEVEALKLKLIIILGLMPSNTTNLYEVMDDIYTFLKDMRTVPHE